MSKVETAFYAFMLTLCAYAVYVLMRGSRRYQCQCPICQFHRSGSDDVNELLKAIDGYEAWLKGKRNALAKEETAT